MVVCSRWSRYHPGNRSPRPQSRRTLRDGIIIEQAPGNELPGGSFCPDGTKAPSPSSAVFTHGLLLAPSILIRLMYVLLPLLRGRVFIRRF